MSDREGLFLFAQKREEAEADPTTGSSSKHGGLEGIPIEPASNVSVRNRYGTVNSESSEATDLELDTKTESVDPRVLKRERTWTASD